MIKNLSILINAELPIQRVYADRIILGDDTKRTHKSFVKKVEEYIPKYLDDTEQLEYYKMDYDEKLGNILQVCKRIYSKVKEQESQEKLDKELSKSNINIENLGLLHDMYSEKELRYVYDKEKKCISNYTYNSLRDILSPKVFGSLDKVPCKTVYEPFNANINFDIFADGHDDITRVNLYKHPGWREELDPFPSRNNLPSLARAFFDHLFPDQESLHYVLSWLFEALTSEQGNEFVLVLNGPTGTGKTIFASDLMKALFGKSNYGKAPKGFFKHDFNAVLENKTIIHGDEAKISFANEDTFKLYANKELNIHKKGIDANNLTQLYFSMILTNNRVADLYVNLDDRRLSIPEMTEGKILEELWDLPTLKEFKYLLATDLDFVTDIGGYILERSWEEEGYELHQFTGPKYFKFRYRHLAEWKKIIVEKVFKDAKNGDDEIEVDKLLNLVKGDKNIRHGIQLQTVVEFLEEYHHDRLHKLGELVIEEEEQILKINDEFIKIELDVTEDNDEVITDLL